MYDDLKTPALYTEYGFLSECLLTIAIRYKTAKLTAEQKEWAIAEYLRISRLRALVEIELLKL